VREKTKERTLKGRFEGAFFFCFDDLHYLLLLGPCSCAFGISINTDSVLATL
jgi:hypothetical protein